MQTMKLRQSYLDFFRKNGHKFIPPSKVYNNDPSLLFVNAGMNQLKDIFLGQREINPKFTQLMNSQICIRAGGKHNDLDDVGTDSYHLTSFEMLGSWSLNNYWKDEAIRLSFTYLTDVLKLDKDRMYATYFEGSSEEGLEPDLESKQIWLKYLPEQNIIPGSYSDNFWMMADDGPCGVSSEIHYDLVGKRNASSRVNQDDPQVIEIWNMVFVEYNKQDGQYTRLDKRFVDTGMGLERLAMVIQSKDTIYQTDTFRYLIGYAQILSGGGSDFFNDSYSNCADTAYRIFVDHIRTIVICLFQGVKFGGYHRENVMRRIFRRLLRHFYLYLLQGELRPIMEHGAVENMVTDILNYYLLRKHDAKAIHQQLIAEEHLFLDKLGTAGKRYKKIVKKIKDPEKAMKAMKEQFGIDRDIVKLMLQKST